MGLRIAATVTSIAIFELEPTTGLEPVTSSLPRKCSTAELRGPKPSPPGTPKGARTWRLNSRTNSVLILDPSRLEVRGTVKPSPLDLAGPKGSPGDEFRNPINIPLACLPAAWAERHPKEAPNHSFGKGLERETGFEPATNSLEGCDSTPELLPHGRLNESGSLGCSPRSTDGGSSARDLPPDQARIDSMVEAGGFEPP